MASPEQGVKQGVTQGVLQGVNNHGRAFVAPTANLISHTDPSVIGNVVFESTVGSGNPINQWTDLSGNGNHWVKPSPNQPDWIDNVQNGLGVVRWDRANFEHMEQPAFISGTDPGHMFVVIKSNDALAVTSGLGSIGTQLSGDYYTWSDDHLFSAFGSDTRRDCGIPPTSARSFSLLEFRSAPGDWAALQNNSVLASDAAGNVAWAATFFLCVNIVSQYGSFDMGEMLWYDAIQTGAARNAIVNGLNTKWALGF